MSEDLSIQQRPSAVPYALGGAATAGAVTYFGAPHIGPVKKFLKEGEGKYDSFDDLVKEANDKDSFKSSIQNAEGEAKTTMEKLQQKVSEAEAKYEADLAEALKAASESATELPADHELLKEQTRLQNALDTKRQTLIDQEVAKLQAEAAKKAKDPKAVKVLEDKIKDETQKLKTVDTKYNRILEKMADARYKELTGANGAVLEETVNTQNSRLRSLIKKMAGEKPEALFADEVENYKKAIAELEKQARQTISKPEKELIEGEIKKLNSTLKQNRVSQEAEALLRNSDDIIQNLVTMKEHTGAEPIKYGFNEAKEKATRALTSYAESLGENKQGLKENIAKYLETPTNENLQSIMERYLNTEKAKLNKVKNFQTMFDDFARSAKADEVKEIERVFSLMIGGEKVELGGVKETVTERVKQLGTAFDKLSQVEKDSLKKLVGENPTADSFKTAIQKFEANIKDIESSTGVLNKLQAEIEKVAGKGAKLVDGKIIDKSGKEFIGKIQVPDLANKVTLPEHNKLTGLRKSLEKLGASGLTPEQIKEQAAKNIDDAASTLLKDEKGALDDIVNKIKEEIAKLPKEGGKTAEEITKEFVEKNGEKAEYVKKALEGSKDDFSSLIGGINKTKLAWVTAGVALVGALIATAMRPSGKDA